jgi:hypothetical protein
MNNYQKSWVGQPTTNLVGDGMSIYNNVSGDVTATLATTGEFYRGAAIYKLTLTPTTASGVSYLTAGNNPGIGVVSGGGGGLANRYTGHSIFFRPTVPMHSSPIYTNYSNIGGWQSSTNYYSMNDGWLRAHVIWYDTVTRSDGKYWAINPAGATLNVPIVIYCAGPFKEDRNDSVFVSPYTTGTRNSTQAIYDLTNNNTWTVNNLSYASDGTFSFNGSNSSITSPTSSLFDSQSITMESWNKPSSTVYQNGFLFEKGQVNTQYSNFYNSDGTFYFRTMGLSPQDLTFFAPTYIAPGNWYHIACTVGSGLKTIYVNGIQITQTSYTGTIPTGQTNQYVGIYGGGGYPFLGQIAVSRVYNRALSASEVIQNFNAQRGLYGR